MIPVARKNGEGDHIPSNDRLDGSPCLRLLTGVLEGRRSKSRFCCRSHILRLERGDHLLLLALARQKDGVVIPVLQKLGADPRAVAAAVEEQLGTASRVEGDVEHASSRALVSVVREAEKIIAEFQDELGVEAQAALARYCLLLLNLNEFLFVD